MHTICRPTDSIIDVDRLWARNEALVIKVEPFIGETQFRLVLKEGTGFKAMCSHLHDQDASFTLPRYLQRYGDIPVRSYFLLAHDEFGYTVFFCLSHQDQTTFFGSSDEEGFTLHVSGGSSQASKQVRSVCICLRGDNLHQTIRQTMKRALEETGGIGKLADDKLMQPGWLDHLGWESGAYFGTDVTHEKVLNALWSLRQEGFQPGFVLIEEGWQKVCVNPNDQEGRESLYSFEADPLKFPSGIKGLVEDLHHAGVKHVGVWHGIMGYRGGIHPQLAKNYELPSDPDGRHFLGSDLGRTFQFFQDYYDYLREQGVTFIQVGDQASVPSYANLGIDATLLYKNLQSALQAAASIHFNSPLLNTDCLPNENLFYWAISRLARAADSIDTSNPMGIMRSIRNNLCNSLWLQHLMQPDFDSWTTNDPQSETLAIFHALSGTINVINDPPGEHAKQLIRKSVLPSGLVVKADRPLTLCQECIFFNPLESKQVYKAYTLKGTHGLIAAFNLTSGKRTLHGSISPMDVIGLAGENFAVFSHHNGFAGLVEAEGSLSITLKPNQSDVLTLAPVRNGVAVFGCHSLFLSPGIIIDVSIEEDSVHIMTHAAAPMVIYCEKEILEVRRNNNAIPWEYDKRRKILSIDSRANIIEVHSIYSITFES